MKPANREKYAKAVVAIRDDVFKRHNLNQEQMEYVDFVCNRLGEAFVMVESIRRIARSAQREYTVIVVVAEGGSVPESYRLCQVALEGYCEVSRVDYPDDMISWFREGRYFGPLKGSVKVVDGQRSIEITMIPSGDLAVYEKKGAPKPC